MSIGNFHMLLKHPKVPQFQITSSQDSIDEGNSFTITLDTQRIPDGTTVGYTISGVTLSDLSTPASLTGNFTVTNSTDSLSVGTNINDDVYIFVLGVAGIEHGVWRYSVNPDLSDPQFLNKLVDTGGQILGMYFKYDGSLLFLQDASNDQFRRYTFTAAPDPDQWNLVPTGGPTTASYGTVGSNHQGMWISSAGTTLFQVDRDLKYILQNTISAWNPFNPGSPSRFLDISATATLPSGISVKPDGTKAFVSCLASPQAVLEYSGTAFQCNTWTLTNSFSFAGDFPSDVYVTDAGTEMYVSSDNHKIYYCTLSTPWDLSTASLVNTWDLSSTLTEVFAVYVAKPTAEVFKITLDTTDSASNRTGSRFANVVINDVELPAPSQADYLVPGSYSFVVPEGLTEVSAVVVGGGGGGAGGSGHPSGTSYSYGQGGSGGAGGGLAYGTFPVTPGETLNIVVGQGGARGNRGGFVESTLPGQVDKSGSFGTDGAPSSIHRSGTSLLFASGGAGGQGGVSPVTAGGYFTRSGGIGGSSSGTERDDGGVGGSGGPSYLVLGGGGGGAAGYAGGGGGGGGETSLPYFQGGRVNPGGALGGGGAGGDSGQRGADTLYNATDGIGHLGGDVGITGLGLSGSTNTNNNGGTGSPSSVANVGAGGGGGGGGGKTTTGFIFLESRSGIRGNDGAVRIIWGDPSTTREYPSTNTGNV